MDLAFTVIGGRIGAALAAALALVVVLGAAAPAEPAAPNALTARDVIFQAAPVPNQDVNSPADHSDPSTTLSPKLLSQKSLFQGDGYYYASSEQTTLDNRRAGVPGLGLSVPVK